ncbi:MAG: endonuclease/exonuclease/phosphatase family protein, partial [Bacteroidales bacterium]|nr:endonuclease/exonuclease/phosphatase family protein [Bacteroidales bacterium]
FNACTNKGPLSLTAYYHKPFHQWAYVTTGDTGDVDGNTSIGGLVGKAWDINTNVSYDGSFANYNYTAEAYGAFFQNCENSSGGAISLTHTGIGAPSNDKTDYGLMSVGGLCGQGNGSIESGSNYAVISVTAVYTTPGGDYWTREQNLVQAGGLVGKSYRGMNMNSCANRGAINVLYDGAWNSTEKAMAAVGGLIGSNSYDRPTNMIKFSTSRGPITVTGWGTLNVGGICGANGSMRGDRVYETATMNVQARYAYVGGLVGFLQGGISSQYIKTSYCEANVTAESVLGDRYAFAVGGLIGRFATNTNTDNVSLAPYSSDSQRCHYTGNVVSTGQLKVGMVIGWVTENNEKVFGTEGTPIQVTGTIHRWGYDKDNAMDEPLTIHAGNVEDYAIGAIKAGTVTIYVESPTAAPVPPANLTLMSFNIREGSNWSSRKSPIVSMINGESPDIIGLQEVKDLDYWDHLTEDHPWDYLRNHLSAYSSYRYSDKTNAILYKTSTVEMSNFGHFWLRDSYSSEGTSWDGYERTVLYATVREKATGRYFFYVTTHFPMNNSNDGWTKCTALLESRIEALNTNNYPVILMGDFNCVIGDACWDSFKTWMKNTRYAADSIVSTENRDLYTYNAFGNSSAARNKVDHIWVSKSGINVDTYVTLTTAIHNYGGYTTNGETFLSDHYPIIAHIS